MNDRVIKSTVTLDRVMVCSSQQIEADMMPLLKVDGPRIMAHMDALEVRRMILGWGRTSRIELRCPATWWQHLKLALRERWPRLFRSLIVRFEVAEASNGVLVPELGKAIADKRIVPWHVPVSRWSLVSDPSNADEP